MCAWLPGSRQHSRGAGKRKSLASMNLSRMMQSENLERSCFHFSIHPDFVFYGFDFDFDSCLWEWAPSSFSML